MNLTVKNSKYIDISIYQEEVRSIKKGLKSFLSNCGYETHVYEDPLNSSQMVVEINAGQPKKFGSVYPFIQPKLPQMIEKLDKIGFSFSDLLIKKKEVWFSFIKTVD